MLVRVLEVIRCDDADIYARYLRACGITAEVQVPLFSSTCDLMVPTGEEHRAMRLLHSFLYNEPHEFLYPGADSV